MDESRITSLDNSFLFLISSVTLVFTVIQAFLSTRVAFLLFMPVLFSGLFYPFYAGCLRGAVEGSMTGRIRGWMCFIVGTATYVAFVGLVISRDFYPSSGEGTLLGEAPLLSYFLAFLVGYVLAKRVYGWLVSVTGSRLHDAAVISIYGGATAAVLLSFGLIMTESTLRYWLIPPIVARKSISPSFLDVWLILVVLLGFVLVERTSRRFPSVPKGDLPDWVQGFKGASTLGQLLFPIVFCSFPNLRYNRRLALLFIAFLISCLGYGILSPFRILQTTAGVLSVVLECFMLVHAATMRIKLR